MTIPFERARAVHQTQQFLSELCDPTITPRVPKRYREAARRLLRHYPTLSDLQIVEDGWKNEQVRAIAECPFTTKDSLFGELR